MTGTGWSPTRTPSDASTSNKPTEKVHGPLVPFCLVVVLAPDAFLLPLSQSSTKVRPWSRSFWWSFSAPVRLQNPHFRDGLAR